MLVVLAWGWRQETTRSKRVEQQQQQQQVAVMLPTIGVVTVLQPVDGGAGAGGEHGAGWGDQWEWWSAESAASLKAVVEVAREFSLSKISL